MGEMFPLAGLDPRNDVKLLLLLLLRLDRISSCVLYSLGETSEKSLTHYGRFFQMGVLLY